MKNRVWSLQVSVMKNRQLMTEMGAKYTIRSRATFLDIYFIINAFILTLELSKTLEIKLLSPEARYLSLTG